MPALPPAQNHEGVVDCEENYEDAPRAGAGETAVDSGKNTENAPRASHQCGHARKTTRGSSIPSRIRKTLRAPAQHPPKTGRTFAIRVKNSSSPAARAFQYARNPQRVHQRALKLARCHSQSAIRHAQSSRDRQRS